ncbi:MAG: alanyl-tRNA editing protein [Oscillospiraceae bacterium]|nr:alanyl-tRNA editing protein [Oscillospiraceae bacterium]
MTEKLYYNDPFCKTFTATILSCTREKSGYAVTLDRTAFYPEGGGQPADHGVLGGASVTDTREKDGEILHFCDRPLPVGETVEGEIDWSRRFDFMQQHSGEHIVSGILCGKFHCDNVGFHIGHDLVTIDFNARLTPEDVLEVERLANRYVWEDHPIDISFPSPDQLEALDYRSKKALTGQVRIVAWPGADCCACCGTHVRSSGQVGMIKLVSCQNFREGVRIELAAGGRALNWANRISRQNTLVSQLLSAKPDATAAAVERLQKELYALHGRVSALEEEDFARKAAQYAGAGDVLLLEPPMSPESLRKLCGAVQAGCGGCCAVFAGEGESYQYAAGCPDRDLRPLCKELNAALNGRGGGKPAFVQGSVQAGAEAIRGFFGGRHPFS